jgi:cellulose synthase/poly-beta-1,6-N-acetylglucosamine synthase-like glycosyltransferase
MDVEQLTGEVAGRAPKVSIILPTYNRAKFLPQAFESIRSQQFSDWELIVVDDGSTDDTRDLVKDLSRGWSQPVRYIYQANQGAYGARNTGLDLAEGEYVAFLDSDDIWLPHHLRDCVAALAANLDVDWVYGACRCVDHKTGRVLTPSTFYEEARPREFLTFRARRAGNLRVIDDPDRLAKTIAHGLYCGLQISVIRRTVFEGRRFGTRCRNEGEDLLLAVRAMAAGYLFGYFDNVHAVYHVHCSNSSVPAGGGASVDKQVRTFQLSLQGFEGLREELPPRARRALDRMLSSHYFWTIGYALLWHHGRQREALDMFRKGMRLHPWNLRFWKTFLWTRARSCFGARRAPDGAA